ncbi:nitrite reductase small subunit NirD [Modestobacter sp. SYSU DS0511]
MTASLERPTATTTVAETPTATGWTAVCAFDDLLPERGVAALVDGVQVAVFRLFDGSVHAVGHRDPFSGAHVLARGLVGTRGDAPTVASPMYKQVFDLRTGQCLDDPAVSVPVHQVRVRDGLVEVAVS